MNNLLLFSDTFPYGMAEPFLQQELPYLASRFSKVEIVPLYLPEGAAGASAGATAGSAGAPAGSAAATAAAPHRPLPDNVSLCKPLLRCNHKSVKGLLRYGLFGGRSSCGGSSSGSCGGSGSSSRSSSCGSSSSDSNSCGSSGTGGSGRSGSSGSAMRGGLVRECFRKGAWRSLSKLRVLLSYWLIMRASLANREVMEHIIARADQGYLFYFYWGDKSVLILPFLKSFMAAQGRRVPLAVMRLHGSDAIEEAKGILPFREQIYGTVDYAVPVSGMIESYIKCRYAVQPRNICTFRLGSPEGGRTLSWERGPAGELHIASCSNVVPLKRVEYIADAVALLAERLHNEGGIGDVKSLCWTHIGDGPQRVALEQHIKSRIAAAGFPANLCRVEFKGAMPHREVLEYYRKNHIDLFIHASRSEGGPVVIMEAASFAIPVISTKVGAVDEMIPQEWIIPVEATPDVLVDKVVEFLLLPDGKRLALKEQNRRVWEERWNAERNYAAFADFLAGCQRESID